MIPVKLEKLKYIIEEMQIAFHLANQLSDAFVARTIARHILIRAENFIEHARALRKPLNLAGCNTHEFNKTKEAYATEFEEYFKEARHKVGAHVQDFDFGKRIELWNDIENTKIAFFVEGAQQIYRSLAPLNLSGYTNYTDAPELIDATVQETVGHFQRATSDRSGVEIGTDPLAMTRDNTASVMTGGPVQARAGQLALIRRWITVQKDLRARFATHPRIAQILKERILTDIVSFCDCLVTRSVTIGALQAMDGLDQLLRVDGHSPETINNFVAVTNFQTQLDQIRGMRDAIGAHIESEDTKTLASILADLEACNLERALSFYESVLAVFTKTCRTVFFLSLHAADGQRIFGTFASRREAVPYSGNNYSSTSAPPTDIPSRNDDKTYRKNLALWLDGDEDQKEEARHYFWRAFNDSEVLEKLEEIEHFGPGSMRRSEHEFRKAHQFIATVLKDQPSDSDFWGLLSLIRVCAHGYPYPLTEILYRCSEDSSPSRQRFICYSLGEIGHATHSGAREFLERCSSSEFRVIRQEALFARFKIFIKAEGLFRTNHQGKIRIEYDMTVNPILHSMPDDEMLICLLIFGSFLGNEGTHSKPFQSNYVALQNEIEKRCLDLVKDDDQKTKSRSLKQLIKFHDYVGVCLLVALELKDLTLRNSLLDYCCDGSITRARHDEGSRNLAMCFIVKKEYDVALEIAGELAMRNPDFIDHQIFMTEILCETPDGAEEASRKVAEIRRTYKLNVEDQIRLTAIEAHLTASE